MGRSTYSDEVKANALGMMFTGNTPNYVSKKLDIPLGTLKGWKSKAIANNPPMEVPTQKNLYLGELIFGVLEKELILLQSIADAASDPEWIHKQSADDLGLFLGIVSDKITRLLETMSKGKGESNDE